MFLRDLLVAAIASGLGVSMIRVAAINQGWWFENFIFRNIEEARGRAAARKSLYLSGTVLLLVGVYTLVSPLLKKELASRHAPEAGHAIQSGRYLSGLGFQPQFVSCSVASSTSH